MYAQRGWGVIPVEPSGKKPLTRRGFKDATTIEKVIREWWNQRPEANIGIATGEASGFFVLDVDAGKGGEKSLRALEKEFGALPRTVTQTTGGGGRHLLFRHPGGRIGNTAGRLGPGLDTRGDGGYIIVAPSVHASGRRYSWVSGRAPGKKIAPAPEWLLAKLRPARRTTAIRGAKRAEVTGSDADAEAALAREIAALSGVPEGKRNDSLNRAAFSLGQLIGAGRLDRNRVEIALKSAALAIGLDEEEIVRTIRSGLEAGLKEPRCTSPEARTSPEDGEDPKKISQRDKVIRVGLEADLWHDADHEAVATVPVNDHLEHHALRSNGFKRWLLSEYGERFKVNTEKGEIPTAPSTQALSEGLNTFEAKACSGPMGDPWVRIGPFEGKIYLDLGRPDWGVIEISKKEWRYVQNPPIRFIRPKGMRPLPIPRKGGSIKALRRMLNVASDEDFHLLVARLVAALRPSGPYPILILNGEQGSGKSTNARLLRRLVDPNMAETRTMPRDERDLFIAAKNGWVTSIDNLSYVKGDFSDAICRISTGGGFGARQLYTDGEEFLVDVTRPQILNGIPALAERPDLLDRALPITIPPIPDGKRKDEAEFWRVRGGRPSNPGSAPDGCFHGPPKGLPNQGQEPAPDGRFRTLGGGGCACIWVEERAVPGRV